jgi:hypothetical protein
MSPKWLSNIFNPPSSIPLKARMELSVQKIQYSLGEQVKGFIKITSAEEFIVNQAFVCLNCSEKIKKSRIWANQYGTQQAEYWDTAVTYGTSCKLFGAVRIPQGFSGSYGYALNISTAAKETLYSIDHYVSWLLYAVLEAKDRPKIQTATYEIQVARPQITQSSPTIMKEVQREVVLIPCTYCSGLMPQTSIFCPNCGARRKG